MFRKKLLHSQNQLPEIHIDIDDGDEGNHPIEARASLFQTPSLTFVHNNEAVPADTSENQLKKTSSEMDDA